MSTEKVPVVVEEEEVEEEVRKYPLRTVIQLIMQSFEPVSTEPGYLLYVRNYLENEEDVPNRSSSKSGENFRLFGEMTSAASVATRTIVDDVDVTTVLTNNEQSSTEAGTD